MDKAVRPEAELRKFAGRVAAKEKGPIVPNPHPRFPPRLKVDEVVRLTIDGPTYRVIQVGDFGARLKPLVRKLVTIEGKKPFMAASGKVVTVSAHAFVYREEISVPLGEEE